MRAFRPHLPDAVAALAVVLLGAWWLWQSNGLREGPGYAAVGPRTFPIIIAVGLLGGGAALALAAVRGSRSDRAAAIPADTTDVAAETEAEDAAPSADWPTLLATAGVLAVYLALFQPLGFVIASTALMAAGARVLGSRAWRRDLLSGLAVSLVTFLIFTRLLGLELPTGPFAGLF